ncbi:MAG TPA: hypothetical protein VFO94_15000 [Gammaproteobacteria bacterium]|nr:hypothetical protein [Gammaproteobacteria bacterium]
MQTLAGSSCARGISKASRIAAAALLAAAAFAAFTGARAQEGHPLKGSWLGTWENNAALGDNILLILDWDGKAITGMINPGTDNIPIAKAALEPKGWRVTIEADAKDKSGAAVHYVIQGHIENLELPNRSIVGTWTSSAGKGKFEASRQ